MEVVVAGSKKPFIIRVSGYDNSPRQLVAERSHDEGKVSGEHGMQMFDNILKRA